MHNRTHVLQTLRQAGLLPLFYHSDPDIAFEIAAACYRGGARIVEYTNRGDFAHEVYGTVQKRIRKELPGLLMGIGSIQDAGTTALYIQLGAPFVVTPLLREDVIRTCNRRKIAVIPGVTTGSEIGQAEELGVDMIKLMPGEVVGPNFVKAHLAPCPWTSMMISGGVSMEEANLRSWFEAGAHCVGMGSKLVSATIVQNKDWATLEENVRSTLALIQKIRG